MLRVSTSSSTAGRPWSIDGRAMKVIVTFFGPDKIPAHAITSGEKYGNIYDVVRYVKWQNATGSLFDDDTATSCMSYYGLCE